MVGVRHLILAASGERGRGGRRAPLLLAGVLALAAWLAPARASAYAWMIRHERAACATCHTDPSGGETLNAFGRTQGEQLIRMRYGAPPASPEAPPEPASGFLWGAWDPPPALALGGSFRSVLLIQEEEDPRYFPMQLDGYGHLRLGSLRVAGSLGVARVDAGSPHARRAQVTTAQGLDYNLISRNHWVGWDASPTVLVRAGRINLPFGVRVPEHVLWVRDQSYTDRESDQHHGVAVAASGAGWRGEVMGIAGNYQINPDRYRERGYSAFFELMPGERFATGVSSLVTTAEADFVTGDQETTLRQAHGFFLRWAPTPSVAVLAEADALVKSRQDLGYVGLVQARWELVQGLQLIGTGEAMDAGYRDLGNPAPAPGFGRPRLGGWASAEWYFWHHMDVRVDAMFRQPVRDEGTFTLLTQLHVYL